MRAEIKAPSRRLTWLEKRVLRPGGVTVSSELRDLFGKGGQTLFIGLGKVCSSRRESLPREPGGDQRIRLSQSAIDRLRELVRRSIEAELPRMLELHQVEFEAKKEEAWAEAGDDIRPAIDSIAAEQAFWASWDLEVGALDKLTDKIIKESSRHDLLTPLEETDMSADFELEVQHVTARSFVRGLQTGDVRAHDLDKAVPTGGAQAPRNRARRC